MWATVTGPPGLLARAHLAARDVAPPPLATILVADASWSQSVGGGRSRVRRGAQVYLLRRLLLQILEESPMRLCSADEVARCPDDASVEIRRAAKRARTMAAALPATSRGRTSAGRHVLRSAVWGCAAFRPELLAVFGKMLSVVSALCLARYSLGYPWACLGPSMPACTQSLAMWWHKAVLSGNAWKLPSSHASHEGCNEPGCDDTDSCCESEVLLESLRPPATFG